MQVKYAVEKEGGSVTFQGNLEGKELAFVIEVGLEALIKAGLVPFTSTSEDRKLASIHEAPDLEQ